MTTTVNALPAHLARHAEIVHPVGTPVLSTNAAGRTRVGRVVRVTDGGSLDWDPETGRHYRVRFYITSLSGLCLRHDQIRPI